MTVPPEAVTAAAEAIHRATCEWDLDECVADHVHDRAAREALEAAAPHIREAAMLELVWRDDRGEEITRSTPVKAGHCRIGIPIDAFCVDLIAGDR